MKLKTKFNKAKAKKLKAVTEATAGLLKDTTIKINNKGIHIKQMDESQVSMITAKIPKKEATIWKLDQEEETKIAIPIEKVNKALKKTKKSIDLEITNTNIKIESGNQKFQFKAKTPEKQKAEKPETEYEAETQVKTKELRKTIKTANTYGQHAEIRCNGNLEIYTENDNGTQYTKTLKEETKGEATATYPLNYLKNFFRTATKQIDETTLKLAEDKPLKAQLNDTMKVGIYIAPRVDNK